MGWEEQKIRNRNKTYLRILMQEPSHVPEDVNNCSLGNGNWKDVPGDSFLCNRRTPRSCSETNYNLPKQIRVEHEDDLK